jgi:hypothetical protein
MRFSCAILAVFLTTASVFGATEVTNIGIASDIGAVVEGGRVAFGVNEFEETPPVDLNGDGDTSDMVMHIYDTSTGILTNLGLGTSRGIVFSGDLLSFLVAEPRHGADVNGDGDASDPVRRHQPRPGHRRAHGFSGLRLAPRKRDPGRCGSRVRPGSGPLHVATIVPTPTEQVQTVSHDVVNLDLPDGIETSLLAKLNTALSALAQGDTNGALSALQDFINQVRAQRGKKIPTADADALIAAAQAIIDSIAG